jgi:hypothetical protein
MAETNPNVSGGKDDSNEHNPIIDAVKALNSGYKNKNYRKASVIDLGGAVIYKVVFQGEDNSWYDNYVYKKGNKVVAYWTLERLLNARDNDLFSPWRDIALIKLWVAGLITVVLLASVIYLSIKFPETKSLQSLVTLLSTGVGYFLGSSERRQ